MSNWLESVYSDSTKYFVSNPYPELHEKVTISIRMRKNDAIRSVYLRYREFGIERRLEMQCEEKGKLLYYRVEVIMRERTFRYQFYLVTDREIYYYTQYRITDYIPEESRDFIIPINFKPAKWVSSAVFYQIFPDRFYNGDPEISVQDNEYFYQGYPSIAIKEWDTPAGKYTETRNMDFYGGDLEGIIQKLDYLQELGVNAVYLNPIFLSPSVHKYDALDYFTIDPHLGGDRALIKLTGELHKRGMKLMLDISINHTSSDGIWFNKSGQFYDVSVGAYHNPGAEEREFYFLDDKKQYDVWCDVQTMPKLNYGSQKLRDMVYRSGASVLKKWVKSPYHIDGWRFDVAECMARNQYVDVHGEVLAEIRENLKAEKEDLFLLAEDWVDCSDDLQGDRWDSTMNYYGCARPIREFVGERDLFLSRDAELGREREKVTAKRLASRIRQFYGKLPSVIQHQMFNLLDSHDVPRLHNNENISVNDYETAVIMMFTLPGTVSVYYGDEVALTGGTELIEECRNPMDWNWREKKEAAERFDMYQRLIALKRHSPALENGGFQIISEKGYVFSYARFTEEELIIVISSTDDKVNEVMLALEDFGFDNQAFTQDYLGKAVVSQVTAEGVKVDVPAHMSLVLCVHKNYH